MRFISILSANNSASCARRCSELAPGSLAMRKASLRKPETNAAAVFGSAAVFVAGAGRPAGRWASTVRLRLIGTAAVLASVAGAGAGAAVATWAAVPAGGDAAGFGAAAVLVS